MTGECYCMLLCVTVVYVTMYVTVCYKVTLSCDHVTEYTVKVNF